MDSFWSITSLFRNHNQESFQKNLETDFKIWTSATARQKYVTYLLVRMALDGRSCREESIGNPNDSKDDDENNHQCNLFNPRAQILRAQSGAERLL